ncbi:dynein axonemal heavy chain 1-like [Polistes fuscatus]|uniref:dynein axonemal heavy chain 1-like n=1 Tax=Polistes fuscatus TaxID=30207 RepID=UPI001CA7F855|nr:dynein axonemal heavy chain 1-like [Polistes fuscatus]
MEKNVESKRLPRNVEMERRRRLYRNQSLDEALKKEGLSSSNILPPEVISSVSTEEDKFGLYSKINYLPLEIFDDEEFDCRTSNDWINLGLIDDVRYPLPAMAFVEKLIINEQRNDHLSDLQLDNLYGWQLSAVTDYDSSKKLWTVLTLDGHKRTFLLPRIYVQFLAEDPKVFARRVAAAVRDRQRAETCIRYNFYLDCMEIGDMPTLNENEKETIISLSTRQKLVKYKVQNITSLMDEIERDYRRTMCDLMWRRVIEHSPNIFKFMQIEFSIEKIVVPQMGKIPTNMKNFYELQQYFHWFTLYVLPEVYEAMRCVVYECDQVSNMNLFVSNYGKSMSLTEFESQQNQTTIMTMKYLKELWLDKVAQSVRMCLRDVGKGWFNLDQKFPEIYNVMKLKRLMDLIICHMQNALRNLVENSICLYFEMLEGPGICVVNVDDDFIWGDDLVNTQYACKAFPVFNVDLMMNSTGAYYSTELNAFEQTIVSILDNSLTLCHQIRQVHPFLLPFLKFPVELFLSSVGLLDTRICEIRNRLKYIYQKGIIPLKAYAKEYYKYLALFEMDVEKYIEDFKNEEHTAVEIKDEISFHRRMKLNLESTLPKNIFIGPFNVNVYPLKEFLMSKREDCSTRLLYMFTEKLRYKVDEILNEYIEISVKLKEELRNVEHLFDKKEWMETIPLTVKGINENMQKVKIEFDILEHFRWNLSNEDFNVKWEAIGFPRKIEELVAETEERFAIEQEKFLRIQTQDEIMLQEKIDLLVGNVTNITLQTDINMVHEIAIDIKRIWKLMKECKEMGILLNERQKLFGIPVVPFENLYKLMKEFDQYRTLWITASDWLKWYEIWMENPLMTIDGSNIDNYVNEMYKGISRSIKIFQEFPKVAAVAENIKAQIEDFKPYVGIIEALRNPGMKPRHFEELSVLTGIQMALTPSLTFNNLIVLGIMEFKEIVMKVADEAEKEYSIEGILDKMINAWNVITMDVMLYKNTGTYIMKISDETLLLLDDHIQNAQQISFSPFKAAFEDRFEDWDYKLKLSQEVILLWIEVQKRWMYLEPIFTSEDISRQLPVETRKFNTMDRSWRRIMKTAYECPYIMKISPDKSLLESLKECISLLEVVQKGLSDYLETKRMIFPRFFFLSDDELLEILAQTKNVHAVQPHLKKCFENMRELRFEDDLAITRMYSAEYEEVVLRPTIYPEGNVENWLCVVEETMRNTLKEIIGEALEIVEETSRKEWVYMWPGQVVLCGGQTYWTAHVEDAIKNDALQSFYEVMLSQLDDLRELVRSPQTEIQRLMLEAVIIIEVHARDVLYKLIQENVKNINDFDWISQLRYYWVDNSELKVRAVNAEFSYGYEYLGNNGRLVITPLTDRCYLTLTGALHLKFGGAPAGPAGTGKTETTKDLAKAFAIQCVVFNCSDQLDFLSMGKFFKGLASAGAWACFDEFNRIDIEVLSVIAQQIMTIQKAQQIRVEMFVFEGVEITLKPSCAIFITMNPGYAGRTELPDNLKALFRPVAMMVPNYTLIAEISLFSYGFSDAKTLAGKITTTFKLSSEQLSTQDHYDFGMRAVKTVIAVAGNLKRELKDVEEQQICLRALRDVNVPKFLSDDLKLFNGIVSDLFPQLTELPVDYGILEAEIRKTTLEKGLEDVNEFVKKVIQLYETTLVRHGLMLVGPTGSGKTKCYQVLKDACTSLKGQLQPNGKLFRTVLTYVLNPKAVTMGQLYGEYDLDTHEWTDGILSTLIRAGTETQDENKRWYVFDGPVDAVWIENMNTVLDDNKKLCLTSGEIMKLQPTQTMIFEVADLRVASPATVSRCGMIYMEPEGLGLEPLINCWIRSLPTNIQDHVEKIMKLTKELLFPGIKMLREQLKEIVNTVDSMMVQSYINLMNYRIGPMAGRDNKPPPSLVFQKTIPDLLSPWAAFATVWSLGATCDYESRCKFSIWVQNMQKNFQHKLPFPEDGLVFDYRLHDGGFTDPIEGQDPIPPCWIKWSNDMPIIKITPETKYADIEVPTMDNIRYSTLIEYLFANNNNILCVGPTGSGKTMTISTKLSRNMPKKYICDFIIFSARTTANQTQDLIDGKLEKRRRDVYGPPLLKKQIFFIDDFNMPAQEVYGAQPPIELIRQFMDFSGWYDRKEIGSFRLIEDVNFIAAMGPPGGGRNPITSRLLRHFHFIAFPEMENSAKANIFGIILESWLSRTPTYITLLKPMVNVTLNVFARICKELLPTPDKSHYTYNLRDLSKVFQGILMADPTKMNAI